MREETCGLKVSRGQDKTLIEVSCLLILSICMVMKYKLKSMEKLKIQINCLCSGRCRKPVKGKKLKELHEQNIRQGKKVLS